MNSSHSDISVSKISESLTDAHIDVIVSGSIGAVESVRFIRCLRRLGAEVTPWLTAGGSQFITPMALSWAAGRQAITEFQGHASHVDTHDACVVAPASANFISRMIHGRTDTPASAIVTSYLGAKKPVMILPSMHDSLANAPAVNENLRKIASWGVHLLNPRVEENKHKMAEPEVMADNISHVINQSTRKHLGHAMITLGGTKAMLDDVRYLGNYSTGSLGTQIAEECYRRGIKTTVIVGTHKVKPRACTRLISAETHDEMMKACLANLNSQIDTVVMCAAVLDFEPRAKQTGKMSSFDTPAPIELVKTQKIIENLNPKPKCLITFKLESDLDEIKALHIARVYRERVGADLVVLNRVQDVSETEHKAYLVPTKHPDQLTTHDSKAAIASHIASFIDKKRSKGMTQT